MKDSYRGLLIKKALLSLKIIVAIAFLSPLAFYIWRLSLRPSRTPVRKAISPGIVYQRKVFSEPRPYIAHVIEIDLTNSAIAPLVTTSDIQQLHGSNLAMTTSSFVERFDLTLAVNGSFFYPFAENTPWDYYPRAGEAVKALGANISNGKPYGTMDKQWNILCFDQNNLARIVRQQCPAQTAQAIAGMDIIVMDGKNTIDNETKAYPRTMAGINSEGNKLWLVVVDGKQPFYSEGVTLKELGDMAVDLGCDRALNLDGGGSSTLVVRQDNEIEVLNAPIHTKIPMRERPIANHLGFLIK